MKLKSGVIISVISVGHKARIHRPEMIIRNAVSKNLNLGRFFR